jgi:hypothetical protein
VTGSAEKLRSTWTAIFCRKGGNGAYTRPFESLEPRQREALLSSFPLRAGELPVIGGLKDSRNWFVLSTERVVWALKGELRELDIGIIRDAIADFDQLESSHSKLKMRTLQITTSSGEAHLIEMEPGLPLGGVWNILKNVGARNKHSAKG